MHRACVGLGMVERPLKGSLADIPLQEVRMRGRHMEVGTFVMLRELHIQGIQLGYRMVVGCCTRTDCHIVDGRT